MLPWTLLWQHTIECTLLYMVAKCDVVSSRVPSQCRKYEAVTSRHHHVLQMNVMWSWKFTVSVYKNIHSLHPVRKWYNNRCVGEWMSSDVFVSQVLESREKFDNMQLIKRWCKYDSAQRRISCPQLCSQMPRHGWAALMDVWSKNCSLCTCMFMYNTRTHTHTHTHTHT